MRVGPLEPAGGKQVPNCLRAAVVKSNGGERPKEKAKLDFVRCGLGRLAQRTIGIKHRKEQPMSKQGYYNYPWIEVAEDEPPSVPTTSGAQME